MISPFFKNFGSWKISKKDGESAKGYENKKRRVAHAYSTQIAARHVTMAKQRREKNMLYFHRRRTAYPIFKYNREDTDIQAYLYVNATEIRFPTSSGKNEVFEI